MTLRAIAAIDERRGIARHGVIPWDIPTDVAYFRDKTSHDVVIMGRKTYESLDGPLSNRRNIVLSSSSNGIDDGFEWAGDLRAVLATLREDAWIIGGAGVYDAALALCDELYLTHVSGDYDCDRFFPAYTDLFKAASRSELFQEKGHEYNFAVYRRTL